MKKILKKIGAIACMLCLMPYAVNADTDEKLYEKYGYQEDFEYEDEIIAHALKTSVPKIFNTFTGTIKYEPVTFNADKLNSDFQKMCEMYSGTYTTEEIATSLLNSLQNNVENYLAYTTPKEVTTTIIGTGSGVVISDDGYVATNAHVVGMEENEKKQAYISSLEAGIVEDINKIVDAVGGYGVTLSDEQKDTLFEIVFSDAAERAEIKNEESVLEVCMPTKDGAVDYESAVRYEAELVEVGKQGGIEGLTQDTAILKIEADNLVALKISDSYPDLNSKIVSAGFPGASDSIFRSYNSFESTLSVTIGSGQIARLVPVKDTNYQAIEITTRISNGSSGGPSVDSKLNIEGLNTYMLGVDNRFGYMIPAEYISDISADCNVEQGEASKTFLLGLQMLQQDYGKTAVECFERVKELQPDTPFIENLIELAENAPANECPVAEQGGESNMIMILIIVGIAFVVLVIVAVVIILIVSSKRKKRREASSSALDIWY